MNSINVRRLRIHLYGKDKLDVNAEGVYPDYILYDRYGDIVCRTTVFVTKQLKPVKPYWNGHPGHPSGHRIYCLCPSCGKKVPVGRLAQHYRIHESQVRARS